MSLEKIKNNIRDIQDFPKKGILFRDLTTAFKNAECLRELGDVLTDMYKDKGVTKVVGIESRGFIMGSVVAVNVGAGLVLARKPGKLPAETWQESYQKEYGVDTIEIHKDAIKPGQKVVIIDDLIATGGTVEAAAKLIEQLGGEVVKIVFLMELAGLEGRKKLEKYDVASVIRYEGK